MPRVVVKISGAAGSERIELLEPRKNPKPLGPPSTLGVTIQTPEIDAFRNNGAVLGVVSDAGDCLMAASRKQADVDDAIDDMLRAVSSYPLYLELGTGAWEAERLPWESLHDAAKQFLAIHNNYWPIARRVEYWTTSAVTRSPARGAKGQDLIKILAVIAPAKKDASDRSAFDEWDALEKVIHHVNGKASPQLGVEIRVLVADDDVRKHIDGKNLPNVAVDLLGKVTDITDRLRNDEPQVVHIFGHGVASGGGHVELANTQDIGLGHTVGSLSIDANDLTSEASASSIPIWAVVLDCCQTAANPGTAASFAHDLITEWIPVSVGMGEEIDAADSHAFAGAVYAELIDLAESQLPPGTGSVNPIEWAPVLWRSRRSLRERTRAGRSNYDAERTEKAWTLPCLYVYPTDFGLERPTRNTTARTQAQSVGQTTAILRAVPGMPRDILDELRDETSFLLASLHHG